MKAAQFVTAPQGRATSRRALLSTLAAASVVRCADSFARPSDQTVQLLALGDESVTLERSVAGRRLSRFRYHNTENFFRGWRPGAEICADALYRAGIVLQLGLSSHLLDVGFNDQWCARNIGLRIDKSLALANLTGLGFQSADMALLAATLSPYGKWRNASFSNLDIGLAFTSEEVALLTRALLDRVREVNGHPRPSGWRR